MVKTLILYFSRKGRTKDIAQKLKKDLDADIIEITDDINRKGFLGLIRTARAEIKKKIPNISPKEIPVEDYDLILLGSPIWGGKLSRPILKVYEDYKLKMKNIAIFLTCLGGLSDEGIKGVNEIISHENASHSSNLSPRALQLTKKEIKSGSAVEKIGSFVQILR